MEKYIKTTASNLSGLTKAAILLCELGVNSKVMDCLKLSESEKQALGMQIQMLGPYNPESRAQAQREVDVLEEALEYGVKRGLIQPVEKASSAKETLTKDTDAVAKLLRNWMEGK